MGAITSNPVGLKVKQGIIMKLFAHMHRPANLS